MAWSHSRCLHGHRAVHWTSLTTKKMKTCWPCLLAHCDWHTTLFGECNAMQRRPRERAVPRRVARHVLGVQVRRPLLHRRGLGAAGIGAGIAVG